MGGKEPASLTREASLLYLPVLLFYLISCSFRVPPTPPFLFLFSLAGVGVWEDGKRFVVGEPVAQPLLYLPLLEFLFHTLLSASVSEAWVVTAV